MLIHRLTRERGVFVLERQRLREVLLEAIILRAARNTAARTKPAAHTQGENHQTGRTELSEQAKELLGTYSESARAIGKLTAAMHLAFALETDDKRFLPEPFTPHSQRGLFQSMRNLTRQNFQLLNRQLSTFPPEVRVQAQQALALEPDILKVMRQICDRPLNVARIRQHGDYHLGQLLYTGRDFLIIDFEGEPSVSISERRLKHSPLKDVASMVQSFHYAGFAALLNHVERRTLSNDQLQTMASWARFWSRMGECDILPGLFESRRPGILFACGGS